MSEPEDRPFRFSLPAAPEGHFLAAAEAERRLLARAESGEPGSAEHLSARFELLRFYGVTGRVPEALQVLESLLATDSPAEQKAVWTLVAATSVENTGNFEDAIALYRGVLEFAPRDPETAYFGHNNLAYSLNQIGSFEEAEAQARAAIAVDPERHNAHKNLGVALEGRGSTLEAAGAYLAAVHAEASDPRALDHLEEMVAAHPEILVSSPGLAEEIARCREAVASALAARLDGQQN